MARRDREPCLAGEAREQRASERGALDRVGPAGDLVEQDERAVGGRVEDRDEVPDVAGERREAHGDRLLVADVAQDLVEHGQCGFVGRWAQPALVQYGSEPERLQRDRLAAGVRAADHDRTEVAGLEVDRHCGGGVEQRVPRSP